LENTGIRALADKEEVGPVTKNLDLEVMSHVLDHVLDAIDFLIDTRAKLSICCSLFFWVSRREYFYKKFDEPHL